MDEIPPQQMPGISPGQMYEQMQSDTLIKVLLESEDIISLLEHEFRGEVLEVKKDKSGEYIEQWIRKRMPIIPNEKGIDEILRILRFMGLNKITITTNLGDEQIGPKLTAFECKLADLFFLKRKEWDMDKKDMPMIYNMIISIVEDAVYRSRNGQLIRALKSSFQNQTFSDETKKKMINFNRDKNPIM